MITNKKIIYGVIIFVVLAIAGTILLIFDRFTISPTQGFIITTDKVKYEQGETVKITVANNLDMPITPQAVLPVFLNPNGSIRKILLTEIPFIGENYGIGFISKFENGEWVGVEPVWRCGNSCFGECKYKHSFEPGEKRVFEWNQTVFTCNKSNRTEKIEKAEPGRYRIMSSIGFDEWGRHKLIYSNEFTINLREYLKKYGFYELGKIRASHRLDCCDCLGPPKIYEVKIEGEKAKVSFRSCPRYPHLKFPEEEIKVKLDRDLLEELVRLHADLDFFNLDIEEKAGLLVSDAGKHTMSYQFQGKAKRIDYVVTENETLKKIEALYEKIVNLTEVMEIEQALERERNREERERQKVIRNFISSDKAIDIVRNLPEVTALFQKRIPGHGAGVGVWQHPTPDEPVYIFRVTEHFDVSGRLQENIIGYYTVDAIAGKIIKIERERR